MTTADDPGSLPLASEPPPAFPPSPSVAEREAEEEPGGFPSEAASVTDLSPEPEILFHVAQARGVVMLIGGTDVGKTTFCAAAARAALSLGRRVAILDADSGQSEIGPPTALGLGLPNGDFARLSEIKPRALSFVGSASPPGFLVEWAVGTRRLADRAQEEGADLILVDMPGLVSGINGFLLHQHVAASLRPSAYVLFERESELRAIRRGLPLARVFRPPISPLARAKTPTVRALRRSKRYADYFQDAREWDLSANRHYIQGGSLFLGRPLRATALEALQKEMRVRLVYVEQGLEGVRVITAGEPSPEERELLARRFDRQRVAWLELSMLAGVVVGLLDESGDTAAIGVVKRIYFQRKVLRIVTPWLNPSAIRGFAWGVARVSPQGKEYPPLRRGEI